MAQIVLNCTTSEIIIKPPYIFKIFKINDIEILSQGDIANTEIFYRYSQDHGRTISDWIGFTKENIRSERLNPIRFFQIEYLVNYSGTQTVTIFDINLIGDFQNVTLDGQKTNLFGVREDCNCLILSIVNDPETYKLFQLQNESKSSMLLANNTTDLYQLTQTDIASLYQPYAQSLGLNLLNKLSNDAVDIFGHDIVYYLTDPDKNGIDYMLHEYQLQNYVCDKMLKATVENNNFPDNQITFNQFDLSLFESFEIQITKQQFKDAFGVDKRPGKDDVIWFCEINRPFRVEHAQQFRSFNNYAVYYKIILTKYNEKANIIGANQELQRAIDEISDNSTLRELMGLEEAQDKKAVVNTEQLRNAAQETLRTDIFALIEKENIENSSTIVSKTNYDLSTVDYGSNAVVYRNFKNFYQKSDNLGFMCWFNLNSISNTEIYNFFTYYDTTYNSGLKINMINTSINVTINQVQYNMDFGSLLDENIWYCLVVNIDQRQSIISYYIYKRNVDFEEDAFRLTSTKLLKLHSIKQVYVPSVIEVDTDVNATILGSDMKITNIRLFLDVIPETEHTKLCNMDIIGSDYKYVIFSDNANKVAFLPFYTDSRVDYFKERRGTRLDDGSLNQDS